MKKIVQLLMSLLLVFSLCACNSSKPVEDNEAFAAFLDEQFKEYMESDYMTAHTFLENPENYGVDMNKIDPVIAQPFKESDFEDARKELEDLKEKFEKFNRDDLTKHQQAAYDSIAYSIDVNTKKTDEKFDYYEQPFATMSGMHYQVPTALADWVLRDEQDVKDYIEILKSIKPFFDSLITYSKKQAELGLMTTNPEDIIKYCQGIVDDEDGSAILNSVYESVDELNLANGEQLKADIKQAFIDYVIPSYQNVIDFFKNVKNVNMDGLSALPNGKEYYEVLVQENIGSMDSVDDIQKLLEDAFDDEIKDLQSIAFKDYDGYMEAVDMISGENPVKTKYTKYEDMLDDLFKKMQEDFPKTDKIDYNIKDVNELLASESGISAYFMIPAIDGTTPRQLRVNPKSNEISSVDTFLTVAHEGFPGHMYQNHYKYSKLTTPFNLTMLDSLAFTEGYAKYVEKYSIKYLDDLSETYKTLFTVNDTLNYYIILQADIGIHYDNWSYDEFKQFVNPEANDDDLKEGYEQIRCNPACFMPYYIGYYRINELSKKAQEELGDKFNHQKFIEALLEVGEAPFSTIEANIDEFIKANK